MPEMLIISSEKVDSWKAEITNLKNKIIYLEEKLKKTKRNNKYTQIGRVYSIRDFEGDWFKKVDVQDIPTGTKLYYKKKV